MAGIFISYRRDDSAAITRRIFDRLSAHFGPGRVFMDIDSIPIGQDFREHIGDTLARCQVMLAVVGPDWTGPTTVEQRRRIDDPADLVRLELEGGLARQIPVVPVLVEGASTPSPLELPESLRGFSYRNAAKVDSGKDFHPHVDRLIRDIEALIQRQGGSPAPEPSQARRQEKPPRPAPAAPAPAAEQTAAELGAAEPGAGIALWLWLGGLFAIAALGLALLIPAVQGDAGSIGGYLGLVVFEALLVTGQCRLENRRRRRGEGASPAASFTNAVFLLSMALFAFSIVLLENVGAADGRATSDALAWAGLGGTAVGIVSLVWQVFRRVGKDRR